MTTIRIVAAILDTTQLVLYKENGEKIEIPQGDARVQRIIDAVTQPLSTRGWADVSIEDAEEANNYHDFEKTSGTVKFFRVAKKFLKGLFSDQHEESNDGAYGTHKYVAPVALGSVPVIPATVSQTGELVPNVSAPTAADVTDATKNVKPTTGAAVAEIMANAKPVSDPSFRSKDHDFNSDTMIAVVGDKIIPGVENLEGQFRNAAKLGSTIGVENFLKRLGAVIDDRGHTVQELLNFMSKGDLPIADDGSIVAYKVLKSSGDRFVDCHSSRVRQRVGSYVTQKNVDASRRTECSTGLHIARRGYLRGFSGNVITLVKIAPEDVIAVPVGEPNKMRARGYHILFEIPEDQHDILRSNQPLKSEDAKRMLALALKGEHIDIIEDVVIGGPKGDSVVTTPRGDAKVRKPVEPKVDTRPAQPLPEPGEMEKGPVVDANAVSKTVTTEKAAETVVTTQRQLFNERKFIELKAFKKSKKKSWDGLGFTPAEAKLIDNSIAPAAATPTPEPVKEEPKAAPMVPENETRNEKARRYYNNGNWAELWALKKSSKVSWEKLGFVDYEIDTIISKK